MRVCVGGGVGKGEKGREGGWLPVYVRCGCNVLSTGGHIAIEGRAVQAAICGFPKVNTIMSVPVQPQDDYCLRVMGGMRFNVLARSGNYKAALLITLIGLAENILLKMYSIEYTCESSPRLPLMFTVTHYCQHSLLSLLPSCHHHLSTVRFGITKTTFNVHCYTLLPTFIVIATSILPPPFIDCQIWRANHGVTPWCHPVLSLHGVTPCCHSMVSPPCCHSMVSLHGVTPCCHSMVSPRVVTHGVTPCCHSMVSLHGVTPCCHSMVSPRVVTPWCHTI